jgi:ankyrin repeat protein
VTSRKDYLRRHIRNSHEQKKITGQGLEDDKVKAFLKESQLERKQLMEASNLLIAAQNGNEVILRLLIESGADVTIKSNTGKTALHVAAMQGSVESVRLLLFSGVDCHPWERRRLTRL